MTLRPCPAWQRRASTCGRALLPHADKHMFLYVLEPCKSEAKWKLYATTQDSPFTLFHDDILYSIQ
jgi:hypothetical protein